MKNIVILYHNDEDGFGGAWAAWKKFKNKASYFPMSYQTPMPKGIKNKDVYFIDFFPNEDNIAEKIIKENNKIVIIDHHQSQAKREHKFSTEFIYSDKNSGCVLAWDYFHPDKKTPRLLLHIEDMDLWKFNKKFTREIIAALDTYEFNFKVWDNIVKKFEVPAKAKKYIDEGKGIIKYQNTLIKKLVGRGIEVLLGGEKAISVNSQFLESEIGNYIYRNKKVIGLIWSSRNGTVKVSLRSGGKINVSKIAAKFGGGGHKYSSGFSFGHKFDFPWKPIGKKVKGKSKMK